MKLVRKLVVWGGIAAGARYLFDPVEGPKRRADLQDQLQALLGGGGSDVARSMNDARAGNDVTRSETLDR